MAFSVGDFFGNQFGKAMIGAFMPGGKDGGSPQIYGQQGFNPLRLSGLEMTMYDSSPAGTVQPIEMSEVDYLNAKWDRLLFGKNSYTDITVPRMNI